MLTKHWLIIFVFLLNGCALFGPTYHKPRVNIPEQWPNHPIAPSNAIPVDLPELAWWQQFDDPALNQLIQTSLLYNNDVNIAAGNLEFAQGELQQIKLNWIPGASAFGGYSQLPALGDPGYFIGILPSYMLNVFQQIKLQEGAQYQVEASRYAKDSARLTVIGQVSGSYFLVLAETQALILYKQLLRDTQKLLTLYQSQYHYGIIAYNEIVKTESTIETIEAQVAITEHNIVVSKNALHFLLNQNPGDLILDRSFTQIDSNKIIPGNLPATVLNNRPDVQEAEAVLKMANADVGVATTSLLPSIKLDAFSRYTSNSDAYKTLNEATINAPLISASTIGEIQANKGLYKAAYFSYIKILRSVFRDVDNDLSAYSAYSRQLQKKEQAFSYEEKNCGLVNSRYQRGIDSEVGVTQCRIDLDQLALTINQAKLEKMMTIVALYQDLGGGYNHHA
jgi:multidrug efflux system outer membrane protein